MSNPIKDKATEWWQLISNKETADAYKSFFQLTWKILKETALLVWLLLCFVLVSVGWVANNTSKVKESVSNLNTTKDPNSNVMSEAAVKLWEASQTSASNAMATARKQLNLPEQPPKEPKAPKAPKATPTEPAKAEPEKSASGKTPEQYAKEQAAKDEAAAKAKADTEAKATQEQAAKQKETEDASKTAEDA